MFSRRDLLKSAALLPLVPSSFTKASYAQAIGPRSKTIPVVSSEDTRFERLCRKYVELGLPAVWIAVANQGRFLGSSCAGFKDIGNHVPADLLDSVGYGSITKPFTGLMVATIVAEGRLNYDHPVVEYLNDIASAFNKEQKAITLGQLVTHTSGLSTGPHEPTQQYTDGTAYRRQFALNGLSMPLLHPVGTAYAYSNVGITIAALAAEKATGVSWEKLISERVTGPLRLSSIAPHPSMGNKIFHCYELGASGLSDTINQDVIQRNVFGPAGCLQGTILDLMNFGLSFLSVRSLPAQVQTPESYSSLVHAAPNSQVSYCALFSSERPKKNFRLSHGGTLVAGRYRGCANLRVNSQQGRAVAIATNAYGDGEATKPNQYSGRISKLVEEMNDEVESYL